MLFEQVSADIVSAMKNKDKVRLMALRNVKKYFIETKTAPGANDELSDEDAIKILAKLAKQGKDTAAVYESQNRADLAEEEMKQVHIIEEYLPKPLSAEELRAALSAIIQETGVTDIKEMGRVMGIASKRLAGKAEGRTISAMVRELLS
ncbi:MAG: GatB/YqeY domain-containing protein [Bacteroidaceae bacterium]|nr:GatB/YqeY domain-containing protein [Bacteroidaceae bacterium]